MDLLSGARSCVLYFLLDPVLGTGLNTRSGTGYWVLGVMPDPVLGTRSYVVFCIRSSTGYQITVGIYLYRIWYQVPDPVKHPFYRISCQVPDPVFYIFYWIQYWVLDLMPDPILGTLLNARSGTGYPTLCFLSYIGSRTRYWITIGIYLYRVLYRIPGPVDYSFYQNYCLVPDPVFCIYCWIQYWVLDFMAHPVLGTIFYVVFISDPVLVTRSVCIYLYRIRYRVPDPVCYIFVSGTGYRT